MSHTWGWVFILSKMNVVKILVTKETSRATGKKQEKYSFSSKEKVKIKYLAHDLISTNSKRKNQQPQFLIKKSLLLILSNIFPRLTIKTQQLNSSKLKVIYQKNAPKTSIYQKKKEHLEKEVFQTLVD